MRLTFFSGALFIMRSESGSFVYSESASLSLISSATMTRYALHCIFVKPLCSVIVWFRFRFHTDTHPLSSSLPFLHHYPPYVVWKGHLALFGLVCFPDASDPVRLIYISGTPLGRDGDCAASLLIDTYPILWQISFCLRKPPSAFLVSASCLYFFVCCCFSSDTFVCSCWFQPHCCNLSVP